MFFSNYDIDHYLRSQSRVGSSGPNDDGPILWLLFICAMLLVCILFANNSFANVPRLPGTDDTDKLQAAGSLLRIVDSFLFKFGARIMAGLSVLSAGWALKEQRFGVAIICVLAAIIIGTAPMWVKNIFDMGGGTLFSMTQTLPLIPLGGAHA